MKEKVQERKEEIGLIFYIYIFITELYSSEWPPLLPPLAK